MNYKKIDIPWSKIFEFVSKCSSVHDSYLFSLEILHGLKTICAFDQALIWFLDANGKVWNQHLDGISSKWTNLYLVYYSHIDSNYKAFADVREQNNKQVFFLNHWENEPGTEFILNYIRPLGIKCSLSFMLYDTNGILRNIYALDKIHKPTFSSQDLKTMAAVIPLLNNIHKKFYCSPTNYSHTGSLLDSVGLTKREMEVANLLSQSFTPANISKVLYISSATVYKHIANIYEKMQEYLVRILA